MPDKFSKKVRSKIMSRIRSEGTLIELVMFKGLREKGIYFQKHYKKIIGSPDVAFPRKKVAVFIDGDFWHGFRYPLWQKRLNSKFWKKKIERNRARDKRTFRTLRYNGWKVIRLWEHQVMNNKEHCLRRIIKILKLYYN